MSPIEMLQQFCSKDEYRTYLQHPFFYEGSTFASEGKIIVRMEGIIPGSLDANEIKTNDDMMARVLKNIYSMLDEYKPGELWHRADQVEILPEWGEEKTCPGCDGIPRDVCDACDGEGEVEWEFDHNCKTHYGTFECPICKGDGPPECKTCYGHGTILDSTPVKIGGVDFNSRYIKRMATLPNCEISPTNGSTPARIRFDGGDGLIMPMLGKM